MEQLYEQVAMDTMSEVAARLEDLVLKVAYNQVRKEWVKGNHTSW